MWMKMAYIFRMMQKLTIGILFRHHPTLFQAKLTKPVQVFTAITIVSCMAMLNIKSTNSPIEIAKRAINNVSIIIVKASIAGLQPCKQQIQNLRGEYAQAKFKDIKIETIKQNIIQKLFLISAS